MRIRIFSLRTAKEILRDPLNLGFGLGFPLALILLLSAIQAKIPANLFTISRLTPGIMVFGLSFFTLFTAQLLAKDRESAFLQRLYTTPMTAADFILGYILPVLPLALLQGIFCIIISVPFGLSVNRYTFLALLLLIPIALFYITLGVFFGSLLNVKQVGGICGALLTNLSAWLSGIWFDLDLVGGVFQKIANILPFSHAVALERAIFSGTFSDALIHLWWVIGYAAILLLAAIALFLRQMRKR